MATSLPLPRGFFTAAGARPSEDQRRQYIEFAESSIRKVFALSDSHKNSWIPVREKKGVAVFRNFGASRGPQAHKSNIAEVGGKGDLHASLDEVARAYAAHDDALFTRLMKKLNAGVMDAAVVSTIVPRSPLAPYRYIGIKWFAVKTPTPLVSHRDYCCLEVQDKIVDGYGNEMYIRILNSIEIKECPSLENSHGLVRAKMLAGYMYRADRAEPSLIRIHHVTRIDPAGYFPSQWAYKMAESQLVSSIVQIKRVVEKQQMNACTFVDKKQWVPNHERLHCAVCSRPFGTFRPRHHCRCCGEVICGKCSIFKSVDVPGTTLKNVRICSICNMGVQKSHRDGNGANDDAMSDISTSSVTSSSTLAHNEMNLMDLYLSANGNPGTPSAYSTASAQSNLSMRSTASSRSVIDARSHRAGSSTPGTARFFKGGGGNCGQNIFSSSSRVTTTFAQPINSSASTPARSRGGSHTPRALFNETNTPRSYIGGSMTPHRNPLGFFGHPAGAMVVPPLDAAAGDDEDVDVASEHELRKSIYKQNPLDLGYLRESVRNTPGQDDFADNQAEQTAESEALPPVLPVVTPEAESSVAPGAEASETVENAQAADSDALADAPTATSGATSETPAQASSSLIRSRGESSALLLPPAKMPRLHDDDIVMEDASEIDGASLDSADVLEQETSDVVSSDMVSAKKLFDHDEPIRSSANSTSTTESSTAVAAPVKPIASAPETPRKSFLAGLFSRASLETKPTAA